MGMESEKVQKMIDPGIEPGTFSVGRTQLYSTL